MRKQLSGSQKNHAVAPCGCWAATHAQHAKKPQLERREPTDLFASRRKSIRECSPQSGQGATWRRGALPLFIFNVRSQYPSISRGNVRYAAGSITVAGSYTLIIHKTPQPHTHTRHHTHQTETNTRHTYTYVHIETRHLLLLPGDGHGTWNIAYCIVLRDHQHSADGSAGRDRCTET